MEHTYLSAVFTKADHQSFFWCKRIQSILSNCIALRFIPVISLCVSLSLKVPGQSIICIYCLYSACWILNHSFLGFVVLIYLKSRSQGARGLRRRSTAARLLRSRVRIPPGAWMFVCCVCCVLSGRSLCDELIPLPQESYRLWCVVVCDQETSWTRGP
jgi:hypothetical protein